MPAPRPRPTAPRHQGGSALIEALVAVLIFSIGLLGLVGLQAQMTRAQGSAKFRADAALLATELAGLMWADKLHLSQYASANCSAYAPCAEWLARVAAGVPLGTAQVALNGTVTGEVLITVSWSVPNEGVHSYVYNTAIQ